MEGLTGRFSVVLCTFSTPRLSDIIWILVSLPPINIVRLCLIALFILPCLLNTSFPTHSIYKTWHAEKERFVVHALVRRRRDCKFVFRPLQRLRPHCRAAVGVYWGGLFWCKFVILLFLVLLFWKYRALLVKAYSPVDWLTSAVQFWLFSNCCLPLPFPYLRF